MGSKPKVSHGSPKLTRANTPRVHDRWVGVGGSNSPMYACGCGARMEGYWEWVFHTNICRKINID